MTMFPIMSDDIFPKTNFRGRKKHILDIGYSFYNILFQATFIERNLEKTEYYMLLQFPLTYSITLLHLKTSSVF